MDPARRPGPRWVRTARRRRTIPRLPRLPCISSLALWKSTRARLGLGPGLVIQAIVVVDLESRRDEEGIQAGRQAKLRECFGPAVLQAIEQAQVVVRNRLVRGEFHHPLKLANGVILPPQALVRDAEIEPGVGERGIQLLRGFELARRRLSNLRRAAARGRSSGGRGRSSGRARPPSSVRPERRRRWRASRTRPGRDAGAARAPLRLFVPRHSAGKGTAPIRNRSAPPAKPISA